MRCLTRLPVLLIAAALATVAIGCSTDEGTDPDSPDVPGEPTYTWHQNIAPMIHDNCVGCHTEGGIAPFSLRSFNEAAPIADWLLQKVESGEMPPWSARDSEDCEHRLPWRDDPSLPEADIAMLRTWIEEGTPEGDADTAVPLPEPPDHSLSGITHSITPDNAYTTSGFSDELICFVLDPELATPQWLTGLQIRPGNLEVVHHATLTVVPPAIRADVEARVGPDGTFNCFGGVGIEGAYPLGVWVPGSLPFETSEGVGLPIPAGAAIVMQIHYHPTGLLHDPDLTEVDMRLTPQPPDKNFFFIAAGNIPFAPFLQPGPNDRDGVEFRIPADVPDHVETMVFPVETENPDRFPIVAAFPHMHYIGVKFKVDIERQNPMDHEPASECLIGTPRWDFEWQRTYQYDAPIDRLPTIGNGDVLTLRCEYDNTLANEYARRALMEMGLDEPVDVFLGEETLDEMCLVAFGILI